MELVRANPDGASAMNLAVRKLVQKITQRPESTVSNRLVGSAHRAHYWHSQHKENWVR